jgi:hypothetical protein
MAHATHLASLEPSRQLLLEHVSTKRKLGCALDSFVVAVLSGKPASAHRVKPGGMLFRDMRVETKTRPKQRNRAAQVALLFGTDLNYKISSLYSQRANDAISESPARGIQWLGGVY